jgi:hypothetical protein
LRIEVNKQNPMTRFRERSTQVDGRSRFPYAAFLICDCNDFHLWPPQHGNMLC